MILQNFQLLVLLDGGVTGDSVIASFLLYYKEHYSSFFYHFVEMDLCMNYLNLTCFVCQTISILILIDK